MKNQYSLLFLALFCAVLISCKDKTESVTSQEETSEISVDMEEALYRPNFHFTPKENWINDPNGMFFYNGYYHLYFQYYPEGNKWGPMHWGHALSTDLVNWKEMPIALYPDELGYIFSGSAVVDVDNTSGFGNVGQSPVVAMYTYHNPKKEKIKDVDTQTQGIAYSLDEGLTWRKYQGNPVINNPGIWDFRDPKVIWDAQNKQWVMTLAAGQVTKFYTSSNLKDWKFSSDFGQGIGFHHEAEGFWECPDLFPMQVEGTDEVKWVHLVSVNPGGPNGGSATQYFVGDFDGTKFTVDEGFASVMNKTHDFWIDFGKDNYAGVTWSNIPASDGRRLFIGWMSNWQYAMKVPTLKWRGTMTMPRELKLVKNNDTYRLSSLPAKEIEQYRSIKIKEDDITIEGAMKLIDDATIDLTKSEINLTVPNIKDKSFSVELRNDNGEKLSVGFNKIKNSFYVDRSKSGQTDFSEDFGNAISWSPRISNSEDLKIKMLLDKTSIELFFDNGLTVMTEIFFPNKPFSELWVLPKSSEIQLESIELHELKIN